MIVLNIASLALPFIGAIAFFMFYIQNDRQDKKKSKFFLQITIFSGLLLIATFITRLISAIAK
jgi:preprotein translocase subunit YajC